MRAQYFIFLLFDRVSIHSAQVAKDVCAAIRQACPVVINMTTGTVGSKGPAAGGDLGPTGERRRAKCRKSEVERHTQIGVGGLRIWEG